MEYLLIGCFLLVVFVQQYDMYHLNKSHRESENQWVEERRELLNRIKPETAQIPHVDPTEILEPVRTDEEWWAAHEDRIKTEGTYPYGFEEEARGR